MLGWTSLISTAVGLYSVHIQVIEKLFLDCIHWKKTRVCLIPEKYCISNNITEVQLKNMHRVYPTSLQKATFADIPSWSVFVKTEEESFASFMHVRKCICIYFQCNQIYSLWENLSYLLNLTYLIFLLKDNKDSHVAKCTVNYFIFSQEQIYQIY